MRKFTTRKPLPTEKVDELTNRPDLQFMRRVLFDHHIPIGLKERVQGRVDQVVYTTIHDFTSVDIIPGAWK